MVADYLVFLMTEETEKVTVRMPEKMLEDVNRMYGESKQYNTRTEVIENSLDTLIEKQEEARVNILYDAAVTSYINALSCKRYDLASNAKEHILHNFSDTRLADELELEPEN